MPAIDLSILNQRQTPAFYADVFANRPAAGFVGRIFVSTNTFAFYRDNGTSWDLIGGPGTGTVTGSGAAGQVAFWSGSSLISGENNLWWDSTNNHFGINTNTPGTAADIHHDQSTLLQLNQTTATNDTRIAFQNAGSSKWRIGNFYSAGSNDYKVNDAVLNINRFTIKSSSGQTFVGDEVTSSGLFVVNNSSSDAHIVALGATAPSIRVRNAGTGASLQFGLGLATTTNNFIQGATGGEFCIFNDSLTAQPILFGIKDAGLGNTQEAARISAARNFIVGKTTDSGERLQINGTGIFTANNAALTVQSLSNTGYASLTFDADARDYVIGVGGSSAGVTDVRNNFYVYDNTAGQVRFRIDTTGAATFSSSVTASTFNANGNSAGGYVGLTIANANTGAAQINLNNSAQSWVVNTRTDNAFSIYNNTAATTPLLISTTGAATFSTPGNTTGVTIRHFSGTNNPGLFITTTESNKYVTLTASGSSVAGQLLQLGAEGNSGTLNISASNVLIGTTTDAGQKLQVSGTAYITGNTGIGISSAAANLDVRGSSTSTIRVGSSGNGSSGDEFGNLEFYWGDPDAAEVKAKIYTKNVGNVGPGGGGAANLIFATTPAFGSSTARMTIKSTGVINIAGIPTSAAGLVSGDIYSNAGILTIVP